MTWQPACDLNSAAIGEPVGVRVAGIDVCIVRTAEGVFALRDECTHGAVPLSEGEVDGSTIECWLHGSRFDLRTGAALSLPATEPVRTFPVRIIDGLVHVDVT
ncbi:MAG: non-heme iron oxygenase ferredoxin subunit [Candidatus Nanopelagicales bacterium]|nr:non-heme iron oxygenase ferredoxin subunit [Candidatus Nanopelagicales bacterium]MCF8536399.1 non-heme iron oxygenase ferredoxin subunit [Candidatus Nanopelagicales bacterium]MCF8541521.1 non-heme iron oxygenase ferredoxin subunit [Candidatus Nanopelagicales bacterium]MCF8557089.1 non-heme iron oxygenase ferredoxin subunit [Candidatus Nanopelagicales bacterium]